MSKAMTLIAVTSDAAPQPPSARSDPDARLPAGEPGVRRDAGGGGRIPSGVAGAAQRHHPPGRHAARAGRRDRPGRGHPHPPPQRDGVRRAAQPPPRRDQPPRAHRRADRRGPSPLRRAAHRRPGVRSPASPGDQRRAGLPSSRPCSSGSPRTCGRRTRQRAACRERSTSRPCGSRTRRADPDIRISRRRPAATESRAASRSPVAGSHLSVTTGRKMLRGPPAPPAGRSTFFRRPRRPGSRYGSATKAFAVSATPAPAPAGVAARPS